MAPTAARRLSFSNEDLEELLEGRDNWTIFEDAEDEVRFLRRRGDVMLQALKDARKELTELNHAGSQLQDAYEALQAEYRDVAGDAAYWKALAESRSDCSTKDVQAKPAKQVPRQEAAAPAPALDPREALRQAAAEAAKAEAERRKVQLERSAAGDSRSQQGSLSGARTPPRRGAESEAASPSPSPPASECGMSSAASEASFVTCSSAARPASSSRSVTPGRKESDFAKELGRAMFSSPLSAGKKCTVKLGPGSAPKRCPGLGTPSRRVAMSSSPPSVAPPTISSIQYFQGSPGQKRIADLVDLFESKRPLTAPSPQRPTSRAFAEAVAEAFSTPVKGFTAFTPQRRA